MKYFGFNLDDDFEELWHELERIQDGKAGHHIAIKGETANEAAKVLAERLTPFFERRMYESDDCGYDIKHASDE